MSCKNKTQIPTRQTKSYFGYYKLSYREFGTAIPNKKKKEREKRPFFSLQRGTASSFSKHTLISPYLNVLVLPLSDFHSKPLSLSLSLRWNDVVAMEAFPIPSDTYKLGFIGAGKMAENIARGVVQSGLMPPSRISTAHSNPLRRDAFESFGVSVLSRIDDVSFIPLSLYRALRISFWVLIFLFWLWWQVIEESDVVIFSVKPQVGNTFFFSLLVFWIWISRIMILWWILRG